MATSEAAARAADGSRRRRHEAPTGVRARLRVFLSADATELPEELAAAVDAAQTLRLEVVAPPPGALGEVDGADVFVGVYAGRYGPRDPATGLGVLEQQYLRAGERPRLIYVRSSAGPREPHLDVLLSRIQADDLASYRRFRDAQELARLLTEDLALLAHRGVLPGHPGKRHARARAAGAARCRVGWRGVRRGGLHRGTAGLASGDLRSSGGGPGCRRTPPPSWVASGSSTRSWDLLGAGHRIVTLTGAGGIGKTRLALAAAHRLHDAYPDGAWYVDFAGVRDPALVAPTLAQALDVRESPGATPVQSLAAYLGPRRLLLVLDSFEAVASAGPLLAQLIGVAPGLQLLVTSRSLLRVRGEHEYVVAPLRVPAAGAEADDDALLAYGAVRLFMERAQAARPDLPAEGEALRAAVEICRRLDGVPLALELAAARVRVLTVEALLARLERGLDALGGGVIDLPERQRTLRATLDWDHDLLSLEEQVLLRRLAVFVRSFTVEAAEDVARVHGLGPDDEDRMQPDIVDGIDALLGKSLLRQLEPGPGGEVRFGMLQTIREYAMQRLVDSGEAAEARARHLDYCVRLAERGRAAVGGPQQGEWLQRLEDAHEELRAALHHADDLVDVGRLVRLCAALGAFWRVHGHFTEGPALAGSRPGAVRGVAYGRARRAAEQRRLHRAGQGRVRPGGGLVSRGAVDPPGGRRCGRAGRLDALPGQCRLRAR